MVKKAILLLIAVSVILVIGCKFPGDLSSEKSISAVELDGAVTVGAVTVNKDSRTVTAVVEPVDISTVKARITVSNGASAADIALKDGQAVDCVVTAEDGSKETWKITVNVTPGAVLNVDGARVVLTEGIIHSGDAALNAKYGAGVPAGSVFGSSTLGYCFKEENDRKSGASNDQTELQILVEGTAAGSYNQTNSELDYTYIDDGTLTIVSTVETKSASVMIKEYPAAGSYISGKFSGTAEKSSEAETKDVTVSGFFKIQRLADNTIPTI